MILLRIGFKGASMFLEIILSSFFMFCLRLLVVDLIGLVILSSKHGCQTKKLFLKLLFKTRQITTQIYKIIQV